MGDLEKIHSFLSAHHVLSLATSSGDNLNACSLFYAYAYEKNIFIVASSEDTGHIQDIMVNNQVAGNILLETKDVGKIQGIQFKGSFKKLKDAKMKEIYYNAFTYARDMNPSLWQINIEYFKMTDNTLGFGKKIIWNEKTR